MSGDVIHPSSNMGTFGKVMAITLGVFAGGGYGFYWKETTGRERMEAQRAELERELAALERERREKEDRLAERQR